MTASDGSGLTPVQERILDLVAFLAVNLVDHPAEVTVDLRRQADREVYQIHVHPDDLGQIIGKGGQTARALRVLLAAVTGRFEERVGLEIAE